MIDRKNVSPLAIGFEPNTRDVSWLAKGNLHQHDVLVMSLARAIFDFALLRNTTFPTPPILREWDKQFAKVMDWVSSGQTLILLCDFSALPPFSSPHTPYLPLAGISIETVNGTAIKPASDSIVAADDVIPLKNFIWRYSGTFLPGSLDTPLLHVDRKTKGSDQPVGGIKKFGDGRIVYLPLVENITKTVALSLVQSTISCLNQIEARPQSLLPDWAEKIQLPDEATANIEIENYQKAIADLEEKISAKQGAISHARMLKGLLAGTDKSAEEACRFILRDMGASVSGEIGKRAESVILWRKNPAVLEIKGVTGGATEGHFRQISRWIEESETAIVATRDGEKIDDPDIPLYVAAYQELGLEFENVDMRPTVGLLVVVSHIETPLDARDKSAHEFPPKVVDKLKGSKVVAVTGVQLLCLYLECQGNKERHMALLDSLLSGSGGVLSQPGDRSLLVKR